jgi:hypothetical protein
MQLKLIISAEFDIKIVFSPYFTPYIWNLLNRSSPGEHPRFGATDINGTVSTRFTSASVM